MKTHEDLCITVFSAPHYCNSSTNKGAILRFDKPDSSEMEVIQFEAVHYPFGRFF